MRILFITPFFYPATSFGGPIRNILEISKRLSENEHEVTVYSSNALDDNTNMTIKKKELQKKLTVFYFKNWTRILGFFITPGLIPALLKNHKKFDIVHLQSFRHFQDIISYIILSLIRKPYIITVRGAIIPEGKCIFLKKLFISLIGKKILQHAEFVVAISELVKNEYKQIGVLENKIKKIPNGLDFIASNEKEFLKKKINVDENAKIILFLGRIRWSKGVDILIKAFKKLNSSNTHLVIAGPDFGYITYCKKLVEELNLKPYVHFIGEVNNEEKSKLLADADMFILPSFYEGFGMVILEAAASHLPIIMTTSCGLADEFLQKNAAIVVETKNIEAHTNAMRSLLKNPAESKLMSERAFELSKKFDWNKIVQLHEDMYEELLKNRRSSR